MFSNSEINEYLDKGYIIKNILSQDDCNFINNYVDMNGKNAYYEMYTNKKFGYHFKNGEDNDILNLIQNNDYIKSIGKKVLESYEHSVLKSYYKSAFMARDIEYHQEYFYNPHHPTRNDWRDFIQIFIALEEHTLENACLKIRNPRNILLETQEFKKMPKTTQIKRNVA